MCNCHLSNSLLTQQGINFKEAMEANDQMQKRSSPHSLQEFAPLGTGKCLNHVSVACSNNLCEQLSYMQMPYNHHFSNRQGNK